MSSTDPIVIVQNFKDFLATIPGDFSLAEWQYVYGQVIYTMGVKILGLPLAVVGQDPGQRGAQIAGSTGGQTGGPIISVAIAALSLNPNPPRNV